MVVRSGDLGGGARGGSIPEGPTTNPLIGKFIQVQLHFVMEVWWGTILPGNKSDLESLPEAVPSTNTVAC
jgi:hypothetical protein